MLRGSKLYLKIIESKAKYVFTDVNKYIVPELRKKIWFLGESDAVQVPSIG
jgi:hypothetical protein